MRSFVQPEYRIPVFLCLIWFQDEIRFLRQKLKETEMSADKDRYLRDKINEDSSHLVRENATLNQQVVELEKQLERVSRALCVSYSLRCVSHLDFSVECLYFWELYVVYV